MQSSSNTLGSGRALASLMEARSFWAKRSASGKGEDEDADIFCCLKNLYLYSKQTQQPSRIIKNPVAICLTYVEA